MKNRLFNYLLLILFASYTFANEKVTNPFRNDGFGAQFYSLICTATYAELNNKEFVYSPFQTMEHNYDRDPSFLSKKEQLINFIGNFETTYDRTLQRESDRDNLKHVRYFINNAAQCVNTNVLKKIKKIFRDNKNRKQYFDDEHLHVALHIRRPNPHDQPRYCLPFEKIEQANLDTINALRVSYASSSPLFHVYCQGHYLDKFMQLFDAPDIVLHIDESTEDTFTGMVFADILLVLYMSSYSYTAGVLSDGLVYYVETGDMPLLPGWIRVEKTW